MRRVRLLFRHAPGASPGIAQRLQALNDVYAPADIAFVSAGAASAGGLASVNIGACPMVAGGSGSLTPAQKALFQAVAVPAGHIAIFLAETIMPSGDGCSAHPPGKAGVVVARGAGRWVLAHEIGHVLDLGHASGSNQLMTDDPGQLPSSPAPELSDGDLATLAGASIPQESVGPLAVGPPVLVTASVEVGKPRARPKGTPTGNGISRLADDALARLSRRRTSDVIDRVASVIAATPTLRRRYRDLVRTHGRSAVHAGVGRRARQVTRMVSTGRTRNGTALFATYAVLRRA